MINQISSMTPHMSAAEFTMQYATSIEKKAMDTVEMAAQELLEMLPNPPAKGQYIDTYA